MGTVNRYSAGHTSESEDMHYHVLEHIQFLLDVEETDPWWLVHVCRRRAARGLEASQERGNPYLVELS
jgi:hypothetical protein